MVASVSIYSSLAPIQLPQGSLSAEGTAAAHSIPKALVMRLASIVESGAMMQG